MKYITWLNEWLENYIKPSSKQRTYERYRQIIKLHISPALGNYDITEISVIALQRFITSLLTNGNKKTKQGLSANFVNTVISVLQNSLKTAYLIGLAPEYVANKIKRPKTKEKQVDCFTVLEQKKIENAVLNSKKDKLFGIVLCLYTGLRIGELLALTWSDIDFDKGLLVVAKTCHDGTINGIHSRIIRHTVEVELLNKLIECNGRFRRLTKIGVRQLSRHGVRNRLGGFKFFQNQLALFGDLLFRHFVIRFH